MLGPLGLVELIAYGGFKDDAGHCDTAGAARINQANVST
jgi:hypothetical protein